MTENLSYKDTHVECTEEGDDKASKVNCRGVDSDGIEHHDQLPLRPNEEGCAVIQTDSRFFTVKGKKNSSMKKTSHKKENKMHLNKTQTFQLHKDFQR